MHDVISEPNNETPEGLSGNESLVAADIIFDLSANHPDGSATKAVKNGWENGDVIFVFFNNIAAPKYLKMSYDGTKWGTTQMNGDTEEALGLTESDSGTMRAVFLPFGNTNTVSNDGTAFIFSEITYSYYLTATLDYTVTDGKVSGAFDMAIPDGYIQFFLDDASASSSTEIELREPHLTPQGIASIAADGTITHTSIASGAPLKGYVYDKANKDPGESKGYLFSGILAAAAQNTSTNYLFTVVSGGWEGSYYSKEFNGKTWYRGASEGRALKMPALSNWTAITGYKPIDLGCDVAGKRVYWSSRNVGAEDSEDIGYYYAWGELEWRYEYQYTTENYKFYDSGNYTKYNASDKKIILDLEDDIANDQLHGLWRMPTKSEMQALQDQCDLSWVSKSAYKKGCLVTADNGHTIYIPAGGYQSNVGHCDGYDTCFYWSSMLDKLDSSYIYGDVDKGILLYISNYSDNFRFELDGERRWVGALVRPVTY